MELLDRLTRAGLTVKAEADKIIVAPKSKITDELRAFIRAHKAELLASARCSANPLMTAAQADACHAGGWGDDEIETFVLRVTVFIRRGMSPSLADDLAERLVLRDREGDDRRMCVECLHGCSLRCPDGAPLPVDVLHRCAGFAP